MMEMDWPYTQKARQQYHKECSVLEYPGQEIKRKTKRQLEKSQREDVGGSGRIWTEIKKLAPNREEWKEFVIGQYLAPGRERL